MDKNFQVVMLRGLPGSGKSTYAKELVKKEPNKWVRLNKDSLRLMLHAGEWSGGREKIVMQVQRQMAASALDSGLSIIVDDTNFNPKHEINFRDIAKIYGASFELVLFDIPVEECIKRDLMRPNPVGKDVILKMFYQNLDNQKKEVLTKVEVAQAEWIEASKKQSAIMVDLDGTLSLLKNRGPFEWEKVGQDDLNLPLAKIIRAVLSVRSDLLIFVSGRDSCCRRDTQSWLALNGFDNYELFMREEGNNEKDTIVKRRMYEDGIKDRYNVWCVFDDRPCVVRMWRSLGLFVFDCGKGFEF